MKAEQEIVLQKKMIIIFSLVILAFTMVILNIQKSTVSAASSSNKSTVTKVYTSYIASEDLFKIEVSGDINSGDISNTNELILNISEKSGEQYIQITSGENNENLEISEEVSHETKATEVQASGEIADNNVASRGSYVRDLNAVPTEYERVIKVKATAYCLCQKCCGKSPSNPRYGYTASGLRIVPGTGMKVIAVDTSVVPLGTEVYVEGLNGASNYGYAIAADTGSAIKNMKIDLYMDTHEQALRWGVRDVNLYILKSE